MEIRYLLLHLTARCNLRCVYCYHGDEGVAADMPAAVIDQALQRAATGRRGFHLQLSGGEPTLVPQSIAHAATRAREIGGCRSIGLQTNGTALTPELLGLVQRYHIQLGISLDGPPAVHERQRGGTADTLRGLALLEAGGIPFRITAVVTRAGAGVLDKLVWTLAGFAMARGIGLDLMVQKGRAGHGAAAPADPAELEEGLLRMHAALKAVNPRRPAPIRWREWDRVSASRPKPAHGGFCHAAASQSLAVTPEGRLYPCTQTCGDPHFAMGTLKDPAPQPAAPLDVCRPARAACDDCEAAAVCPGDCPGRLHYNPRPDLACTLYRTLFRQVRRPDGGIGY
jgi:uncharacterized protein